MAAPLSRRSALIALVLILPAPTIGALVGFGARQSALGIMTWIAAKIWLFGLPLIWSVWVDRQPLSVSRPRHGGLGVALLLGGISAAAIGAAYWLCGRHLIDPALLRRTLEPLHLTNPTIYLGAAIYWSAVNSVLEEYVFRWFIVTRAQRLMPAWTAVLLSAAAFVVHHTVAMSFYFDWRLNALGSTGIFVAAAVWSALYVKYRSVWVPYIAHVCADLAIFAIGWLLLFG